MSPSSMSGDLSSHPRLKWFDGDHVRPYVYVREEHRIEQPGRRFRLDWFRYEPIFKNPWKLDDVEFADQILRLESRAFAESNMPMPRWVFYDCAVMPGFVAGFAIHRDHAVKEFVDLLKPAATSEWLPVSLFIIIPTMGKGEWVAHNLCSINSYLPEHLRFYGLGFLTKAFGLWYANIEVCCGMTQWRSPSIRLHTHYGDFEVLTAYTPVHSYAQTLTYRLRVDTKEWKRFFKPKASAEFARRYEPTDFTVDRKNEESLKTFQRRLERREGRYFLDASQIRTDPLDSVLNIYKLRA